MNMGNNTDSCVCIGIVVQYYDFRNDLRDLINHLHKSNNLILFISRDEDVSLSLPRNLNWRYIDSYKSSFRNKVWNLLYVLFGNRPKSRRNSLNWIKRRFGSSKKNSRAYSELFRGYLSYYFPDFIDFDFYLKHLDYNKTDIEDVDVFLSFTDVNDPYFLAQLVQEKRKVVSYVYSWDHAGKYHRFSRNQVHYLTWNSLIKEDLIFNHNINTSNIDVVGSTQLSLLRRFQDKHTPTSNSLGSVPYVYFAASAGYRVVAEQEIAYAEHIADVLIKLLPEAKLVFRPYPLLKDWDLYDGILQRQNVVFDNFRASKKEFIFTKDDLDSKFKKISDAIAVFHCGSTFGMEASYFDSPVFLIRYEGFPFTKAYKKNDSIENYLFQYHIRKYLDLREYSNVLDSHLLLEETLNLLIENRENFLKYNHAIRKYTPLDSLNCVGDRIIDFLLRF